MPESKILFDPPVLSRTKTTRPSSHALYQEAAHRLQERLEDVTTSFAYICDWDSLEHKEPRHCEGPWARDDAPLRRFDLITSCLALQTANALDRELARIHDALADGGLFLAVMMGGQTLHELRSCLMEAEIECTGGASPRVAPQINMADLGPALSKAGFALPVVDYERVQLTYPNIYALMHDLRIHGCASTLRERSKHFTRRILFEKADMLYKSRFPASGGDIITTIDFVFLHGWKN